MRQPIKALAIDSSNTLPAGMIKAFAGTSVPMGWLLCNGNAVLRATYALLFNAIGVTYGSGNGTTTFNLPDFRGMFLRGAGTHGTYTSYTGGSISSKQGREDQINSLLHEMIHQAQYEWAVGDGDKAHGPGFQKMHQKIFNQKWTGKD